MGVMHKNSGTDGGGGWVFFLYLAYFFLAIAIFFLADILREMS